MRPMVVPTQAGPIMHPTIPGRTMRRSQMM